MDLIKIAKNISILNHDSLCHGVDLMIKNDVSGIAVVDKNKKLVGVLSAKDLFKSLISSKYHNLEDDLVSDLMVDEPSVLNNNTSINELLNIFSNKSFHYYPIIDKDNNYLGTIYRKDVLKYIHELKKTTW